MAIKKALYSTPTQKGVSREKKETKYHCKTVQNKYVRSKNSKDRAFGIEHGNPYIGNRRLCCHIRPPYEKNCAIICRLKQYCKIIKI